MVKLVIFDLDGTILDTLEDLTNSTNYALELYKMPKHSIEDIRNYVGNGIANLIHRAVEPGCDDDKEKMVLDAFKNHYKEHCADCTKPYPGVLDLLKNLKGKGIKTAVVSNKADFAVQNLVDSYFNGLFDYAVGEKRGVNKKPAPDSVFNVLSRLSVESTDVFYVGDSDVDILTAKNANIRMIAVDWGFRSRDFLAENGAKIIVSDTLSLEKCLYEETYESSNN